MTLHGEYKVPGGKLVKVDFEIADGRLRDVVISGDFFLYPEEALDDLRSGLEGLQAGSDQNTIAASVRDQVRPGTDLIGTSPEAIAGAVWQALEQGGVRTDEPGT